MTQTDTARAELVGNPGDRRKWWTLGAVGIGLFMIMIDNTVVNVALPTMQHDLGLSLEQLEWVVTGYALTFATFMLMLDLGLFRDPNFTGANLVSLLVSLAMFGVVFYIIVAPQAGRLTDTFGARWIVGIGMTLIAISLTVYSRLDTTSTFRDIVPGLLTGGVGMAMTMTPTTATTMAAVPTGSAGMGSAILNSMRQLGGSLGIAVIGAIMAQRLRSSLAAGDPARTAFVTGFQSALLVAAIIAFAGALTAVLLIRGSNSPTRKGTER